MKLAKDYSYAIWGDFLVAKRSLFVWAGRIVEVQTITGKLFYVAQMVDHGLDSQSVPPTKSHG
jgi:hypothetical protein